MSACDCIRSKKKQYVFRTDRTAIVERITAEIEKGAERVQVIDPGLPDTDVLVVMKK